MSAALEPPRAHQSFEQSSRGSHCLRRDGLARYEGHVGDVALVEEPEPDLQLRLEARVRGSPEHPGPRAEGDELLVPIHVRHDREQVLRRVLYRLGGRERLLAQVGEVGHLEEATSARRCPRRVGADGGRPRAREDMRRTA